MKAVQFDAYGGPEVLKMREVASPALAAEGVVVDVHAVSMNPIDWKIRSGRMASGMPLTFPAGTGRDGAGVVSASHDKALIGKRVMFFAPRGVAAWAEQIAVPADNFAVLPESISFADGAALPLAGTSAWIPLVDIANVGNGTRVLIHAGAGGVGSLGIQIAKSRGAEVIATASSRNVDFVKSLGADRVIAYDKTPFESEVSDVDVVFDTMGGEVHERSYKVLKRGGLMVCLMAEPYTDRSAEYGVTVKGAPILPRKDILESLAALAAKGSLRVSIEHNLPITEFQRAHELSQSWRVRGKIVLRLRNPDGSPIG
ncbi:MAG: NADP-dependent oxidoreductase [Bradyrhizobium sp.]